MGQYYVSVLLKTLGLGIFLALIFAFGVWIDPWLAQSDPLRAQILNTLPLWALFLILLGIFARPSPAALLTLVCASTVFYLNHLKQIELNQPLLFTDLFLLPQVLKHLDFLAGYIHVPSLLWLLLATGLGLLLAYIAEPAWLSRGPRIGALTLGLGLLVWLGLPQTEKTYLVASGPYRPWAPVERLEEKGWWASAVLSLHQDIVPIPEVDQTRINRLRSELSLPSTPLPEPLPDIVVILSESFFEPRHFEEVNLCAEIPAWCELLENGAHGEMTVPTFGGNTTRTEYEVLTGVPYRLLPQGVYPYTSIVLQPTASIAWWLKYLGYDTVAIHPHDRFFWQRHRALPLLGFDRFIGEQEFGQHQRSGFWISDQDLTTRIIDQLGNQDAPQFIFAISMENHGPWNAKQPNIDQQRLDSIQAPVELDDQAQREWRNYRYHQDNSIESLDRLIGHLEERGRPSLVLFFGDHLPGLHATYRQLSLKSDWTPLTHPVPYFGWHSSKPLTPSWSPQYSYELGAWLLTLADIPKPSDYELVSPTQYADHISEEDEQAIFLNLQSLDPETWGSESCTRLVEC